MSLLPEIDWTSQFAFPSLRATADGGRGVQLRFVRRLAACAAMVFVLVVAGGSVASADPERPCDARCEIDKAWTLACENSPSCGDLIMLAWNGFTGAEGILCGGPCGEGTPAFGFRACAAMFTVAMAQADPADEGSAIGLGLMSCLAAQVK